VAKVSTSEISPRISKRILLIVPCTFGRVNGGSNDAPICPSSPPSHKNISLFQKPDSVPLILLSLTREEGRSRDRHGGWVWDAMDALVLQGARRQGRRRRRVVLISRCWIKLASIIASDGGYQARHPGESAL